MAGRAVGRPHATGGACTGRQVLEADRGVEGSPQPVVVSEGAGAWSQVAVLVGMKSEVLAASRSDH